MTTRDTRTAEQAYLEHHAAVTALLERLLTHYADHDDADAERLDWGHVGSIAHVHEELRQVADFVFGEGEHAA
jgi:hypothetical protein